MDMDCQAWLSGNTSRKRKNTSKKKMCFSWLYGGKTLTAEVRAEIRGSKTSAVLSCDQQGALKHEKWGEGIAQ